MYRRHHRKSINILVFIFFLIIATTPSMADRIGILEKSTLQQTPLLTIYDPLDQFVRQKGPGLPSKLIQFGDIVDAARSELNGDVGEELILLGVSRYGYKTLAVLEQKPDTVQPYLQVINNVSYFSRYFEFITVGNFDGDAGKEIAVVLKNRYGKYEMKIYDLLTSLTRIRLRGVTRTIDIAAEIVALTSADLNGDAMDELIIARKNSDGTFSVEMYHPPSPYDRDMGAPLSSFVGIRKVIPPNCLTAGEFDGDPEPELGLIQKQSAGYQLEIFDAPRSRGENAGKPLASELIGSGEIIALTALNVMDRDQTPNALPEAVIEGTPRQDFVPLDIYLDGSRSRDPDGSIVSYEWNLGDGSSADGPMVEYTYETAGIYRVTLTVTDDGGAQDSTAITVEALEPETSNESPRAIIDGGPDRGTAPLEISLDARSSWDPDGFIQVYRWNLGDGTIDWGQTIEHEFERPGLYRVVLTVTDNEGAQDSTQLTIEVSSSQNTDDSLTDEEEAVFHRINQERQNANLPPLRIAQELLVAARRHSNDMAQNNIFSHTGSDGSSPFDRMIEAGYRFRYAGENVAAGYPTAQQTVNAWMNSAGHRRNILNRNFCDVGIGYAYDARSSYRNYWTLTLGCR